MYEDFKKFVLRGNVMDMAVGIILGAAFALIAKSLVTDVLMPPIGLLLGQVDFSELAITLRAATADSPAVEIRYGAFLNTVVSFVITAFAVFLLIRWLNKLRRDPPPPDPTEKDCEHCATKIPIAARRCPHCTSELAAG